MYTLKVNGNYNVLVNDINVYVSPTMSPVINQEQLDSSANLRKLVDNGIIVVSSSTDVVVENKISDSTPIYQDGSAYVKGEQPVGNPEGVFVANPKGVGEKIEQQKEEEVTVEEVNEVVLEDKVEVLAEALEQPLEEIVTEAVVEESTSNTVEPVQKGRPKKIKN